MAMDKEKKKLMDAAANKINKAYGKKVVKTGREAIADGDLTKRIIKTPSLELNEALHCGGFCGIVELFGLNQSGKTSLMLDTIAMNQKNDENFVATWVETEGSVTEQIMLQHGIDMDRIFFIPQDNVGSAESTLDVVRGLISEPGLVDLFVINSVAGLMPKKEYEDDLEKQNVALIARTMSKFFRVANNDLNKNKVTAVFINQLRDNVGVMYGDPTTTTGGKALGYYASQRIRMIKNKIMASDPITEEEGVKIGFSVKKNRFAGMHTPETKGCYYATYEHGVDTVCVMPQMLLAKGLVENKGAWWYIKDPDGNILVMGGTEGKFASKAKFVEELRKNNVMYTTLLSQLNLYEVQSATEIAETRAEEEANNAEMEQYDKEAVVDDINDFLAGNGGN